MKPENNWRNKTLENLEKVEWPHFDSDSRLIRRTKELRKIPLNTFTTEDLRIMIGQQIGLDYLIPLALETLKENLFAEGDFYEGDLLKNVLDVKAEFWNNNKPYWLTLHNLIKDRMGELAESKIDASNSYKIKHNSLQ
jgi:hypothetical protein